MENPSSQSPDKDDGILVNDLRRLYKTTSSLLTKSVFASARYDHTKQPDSARTDETFDALDEVASQVRQFFNAESCGIFLISWKNPQEPEIIDWDKPFSIRLEGTSNEKHERNLLREPRLFAQPTKTSFILYLLERVAVQGTFIISKEDVKLSTADQFALDEHKHFKHLKDNSCYTLMAAPLIDQEKRLFGFIRVENKHDLKQNQPAFFAPKDIALMNSLAEQIILLVKLRYFHDSLKAIMTASPHKVLKVILEEAVYLLRGNRADFTFCSESLDQPESQKHLKYAEFFGHYEGVREGDLIKDGFILDTWLDEAATRPDAAIWSKKINSRWTTNIHDYIKCGGHYRNVDDRTKSEIAVRFLGNGFPLGVLNVEAFCPNRFKEQDEEVLQIMAQHAAVVAQVILAREEEMAKVRLYGQLVNRLPQIMILQKNKASEIIFWNEAFRHHVNKSEEEMKGSTDYSFFPEQLAKEYRDKDKMVMEDDDECDVQFVGESLTFFAKDILEIQSFSNKLISHADPVSAFLYKNTDFQLKALLTEFTQHNFHEVVPPEIEEFLDSIKEQLCECLSHLLNTLIKGSHIYKHERFLQIPLRPETRRLLDRQVLTKMPKHNLRKSTKNQDFLRLNRLLFEDAYPTELRKHQGYEILYKTWDREPNRISGKEQNGFMEVTKIRMTNPKGELEGVQCIFWDITDRVKGEHDTLHAINHRVKNNLFILELHADRGKEDLKSIIRTMDYLHEKMYTEPDNPNQVKVYEFIREVVDYLLKLYDKKTITIFCDPFERVSLPWERAHAICMIVVELVTNSIKHAFKEDQDAKYITISMRSLPDANLCLTVEDNGRGFDYVVDNSTTPRRSGLGLKQIKGWAERTLNGSATLNSDKGTKWEILFRNKRHY